MSRRDQIRMTDEELAVFIEESHTVTCATLGPRGRPHLMPLWFAVIDGRVAAWTYASSQKIKNLQRDPRATLQFEAGESYDQLRGAMLECDVELISGAERVLPIGLAVAARYAPGELTAESAPQELKEFVAGQAAKRTGMVFTPTHVVTWDHRKLGGGY